MICTRCKKQITRYPGSCICIACSFLRADERTKVRAAGAYAVAKAIKYGLLPPLKYLLCVDCGKPAQCYDHRDYRKPLEVEPVCKKCDCLRGSGAPFVGCDPYWAKRGKISRARIYQLLERKK